MADQAAILTAFMMGAPLEALSLLLNIDAEDAVRRELRRIASEASGDEADPPAECPTRRRKAKAADGSGDNTPLRSPHGPAIVLPAVKPQKAAGKKDRRPAAPRPRTNGHAAADDDEPRQATWRDTIRTALMVLGPATVDDIEAHLRECGITRPRSLISTTLGQLRDMGQVERRGEQWVLNHE